MWSARAARIWRRIARFCWSGSFLLLFVAVVLNIVGLNIGKWLQNAGGVGTYRSAADTAGRRAFSSGFGTDR